MCLYSFPKQLADIDKKKDGKCFNLTSNEGQRVKLKGEMFIKKFLVALVSVHNNCYIVTCVRVEGITRLSMP